MNPELDVFLNEAFQSVQPTSSAIGRVVVTPDFEADADPQDQGKLADELTCLLREQSPDPAAVTADNGIDIQISNSYGLLAKYVRSITLHRDPPPQGAWVEVVPPGSWI